MALGSKDYNEIAAVFRRRLELINDEREETPFLSVMKADAVKLMAVDLAEWMRHKNPRFDKQRFLLACGPEE